MTSMKLDSRSRDTHGCGGDNRETDAWMLRSYMYGMLDTEQPAAAQRKANLLTTQHSTLR